MRNPIKEYIKLQRDKDKIIVEDIRFRPAVNSKRGISRRSTVGSKLSAAYLWNTEYRDFLQSWLNSVTY